MSRAVLYPDLGALVRHSTLDMPGVKYVASKYLAQKWETERFRIHKMRVRVQQTPYMSHAHSLSDLNGS